MKIFCIGLSRTGTRSLTTALQKLGYKAIHYPRLRDVLRLSEEYDAMADTPICLNFKILEKMYPDAKFILTTRDPDDWLRSCVTFFSKERSPKLTKQQEIIRGTLYGEDYYDEDSYRKGYDEYHKDVMRYFSGKMHKLLIMNIVNKGEGYDKICPFLGKEILNEEFPHEHKRNYK